MDDLSSITHAPGVDRLVAGAVVYVEDCVLVLRRSAGDDFLPGIEELPSGGCEAGETLGQALDREVAEEIGWSGPARVDPGFVAEFDYLSGSGARTRQYTFAVPLGEQIIQLSPEHSNWRWLGRGELDRSDLTHETRRVLEEWWARQDRSARD
ncbi:NUDIX domain-containing protein [Nocardioides ochotonae]|uniref:NUDIX domain-containing protein n=1 Tax=Nocardioides ochotonae TaxID=2685869 RepID=UPI00140A046A